MPQARKVELDEELQGVVRHIVVKLEQEDNNIRKSQIRQWKKYEEYWNGLQMIFWSETDQNWIAPDAVNFHSTFTDEEIDQLGPIYDYVVDIYKAHGESIIAALSSQIPTLRFRPDDADDENDRLTAKTYSKVADLIYIHNKARLLFIQALYFLYNMGNVFSYRYTETDVKFGTYKVPIMQEQETKVEEDQYICTACGNVRQPNDVCAHCNDANQPALIEGRTETQPIKIGDSEVPKARIQIIPFSPLHVKIPTYATNQATCGYLMLKTDHPQALVKSVYSDIADKIEGERLDSLDRFSRSAYSYPGNVDEGTVNLTTVTKAWLRPWEFWEISDKKQRETLLKEFPKGIQVTFIGRNKVFAEAYDESLDDRWEIGKAGLSTYIHSNPIGRTIAPIQDMRNELINLTMDTIDHGNPAVYAEADTLDFDTYGRFESKPGVVYVAKARSGQPLAASFYAEPRSAMSKEHMLFFRQLDQDAQFASGDFPSIHGGPSEGKSRTLGEYAMSKQMALQRLTLVWEFVLDWWVRTIHGAVLMFVDMTIADERYTRLENNKYINVWIRMAEMEGKVGGVEPEGGGTFPVTLVQKRDTVLTLMELNNPVINEALYSPVNAKTLRDVLALEEFTLPGEEQRTKQANEISVLIKGEPIEISEGELLPTVMPDNDVDDHQVHAAVTRAFLVSVVGLDLKNTNPGAYMNCVAHLRVHVRMDEIALLSQTTEGTEVAEGEKVQ